MKTDIESAEIISDSDSDEEYVIMPKKKIKVFSLRKTSHKFIK